MSEPMKGAATVALERADSALAISEKIAGVLLQGDLSRLSPPEKLDYYQRVCESLGLNPLTKPFEFLKLNGREVLYARRDCTEQLRKIHGIALKIVGREVAEGVYVVTAQAMDRSGRTDESIGAVPISNLQGENRANAMMKAETKAKRRVTLSICGLGMTDESEIDSIPGAHPISTAPARGDGLHPLAPTPSGGERPLPFLGKYCLPCAEKGLECRWPLDLPPKACGCFHAPEEHVLLKKVTPPPPSVEPVSLPISDSPGASMGPSPISGIGETPLSSTAEGDLSEDQIKELLMVAENRQQVGDLVKTYRIQKGTPLRVFANQRWNEVGQ